MTFKPLEIHNVLVDVLSLIQKWLMGGVISEAQAEVMRRDVQEMKQERSSHNIIVTLSTIGAVVLGLGVILFVGSNWKEISAVLKVFLLVSGTFAALWGGYYLTFMQKSYTKVGNSLILLASLLYCATIFLIAQIYHIQAHNHVLLLLCLGGIVPLTYFLCSRGFAILSMFGFYLWLGFVSFRSFSFNEANDVIVFLPVLILLASILVFFVGGFHFMVEGWQRIGRVYRLTAIRIGLVLLLLFTFHFFSGALEFWRYDFEEIGPVAGQLSVTAVVVGVMSLFFAFAYMLINPTKSDTVWWEGGILALLDVFVVVFLMVPRTTDVFLYLFNGLFISIVLSVIVIGYRREDMALVNTGVLFASLYILFRYVDLFWELMNKALFFTIGGVILVSGGFFLERQRRLLKKKFNTIR